MMFWVLIGALISAALIAVSMGDSGTLGGLGPDAFVRLVALSALAVFLLGGLRGLRLPVGETVKNVAIWLAILFALVLGYSLKDDLRPLYERVASELAPPGTSISVGRSETGDRSVRIRKRPDGHFVVRTTINGQTVQMLVDTGASKIVLTQGDARRAGIDVDRLNYAIPVSTANGTGFAAATRIDSIDVGGIRRTNLDALVARPDALRESLLGMNYLEKLRAVEFSSDFLTLRG